jgi:hypothetical protein
MKWLWMGSNGGLFLIWIKVSLTAGNSLIGQKNTQLWKEELAQ